MNLLVKRNTQISTKRGVWSEKNKSSNRFASWVYAAEPNKPKPNFRSSPYDSVNNYSSCIPIKGREIVAI